MLEMRPNCEACGVGLPADARSVLICSFECTFCASCAGEKFDWICPNCGGELVRRPVRPANQSAASPAPADSTTG
ncbi:MAG: DUF1272 domain-containing protein [Woeseiaceae bacterium]|nr:DUF1272 domain-containing protein [Woeseiaceae bacterium]